MKDLLKRFWNEEDGGADQLIVAAILVVVGIGIAIMFGGKIKDFVIALLPDPSSAPKVEDYSK